LYRVPQPSVRACLVETDHFPVPVHLGIDKAILPHLIHRGMLGLEGDVTEEIDRQIRQALQRRRRSPIIPILLVAFAIGGTICAYLWLNFGDQFQAQMSLKRSTTTPAIEIAETQVTRADFDALEQRTARTLQAAIDNLDAQKADLKKLSDQVADLAAKIDAMQSPPTAALPQQSTQDVIVPLPAAPSRSRAAAPRKKPFAPKPSGPISIGGAPLPSAPN
jgi:hypothetical protein